MVLSKKGGTLLEEECTRLHPDSSSVTSLRVVLWAVHEIKEFSSVLRTIIAPFNLRIGIKEKYCLPEGKPCKKCLKPDTEFYFCVPLSESKHLPLEDESVR